MKILHVVQGYYPAIGGTERVIQLVSEQFVSRYRDEVNVYTTPAYNCELFWRRDQPSLPIGVEEINGVTVRRFPVFNRLNYLRRKLSDYSSKYKLPYNDRFRALLNGPIVPGMTRAIAESGADLIAASSFPLMHMHYALEAGKKAGIPVLYFGGIHAADDWGFNRPMIFEAIKEVDAYIAYTKFEKDFLTGRGVDPAKITPIGVGVDPESFEEADGTELRQRLRLGSNPVVAFVGQQVQYKGIEVVIDAMEHVWKQIPNARLLIAGSRTTYSEVIAVKISRLPLEQRLNVVTLDNFKEDEKPSIFAACDVLAFPSVYESFGIVFIEAWSASKPVIGLRLNASSSVVDDGVDGLLVMPGSPEDLGRALAEVLADEDKRKRMGEAGHRKVREQYTWDIVIEKYHQVYEAAAKKGKVKVGAAV
ncbi:MAG: glycosyltransferase family 4 protein [Planctomycetota bacterium]|jgi:glycosyltransferase involved in cell wall biosynthesis